MCAIQCNSNSAADMISTRLDGLYAPRVSQVKALRDDLTQAVTVHEQRRSSYVSATPRRYSTPLHHPPVARARSTNGIETVSQKSLKSISILFQRMTLKAEM